MSNATTSPDGMLAMEDQQTPQQQVLLNNTQLTVSSQQQHSATNQVQVANEAQQQHIVPLSCDNETSQNVTNVPGKALVKGQEYLMQYNNNKKVIGIWDGKFFKVKGKGTQETANEDQVDTPTSSQQRSSAITSSDDTPMEGGVILQRKIRGSATEMSLSSVADGNDTVKHTMEKEALKQQFWEAIQEGNLSEVEHLIIKGVKLHCHLNEHHITALHHCAEVCNTELFQLLLAKGASLKKRDRWMDTPLHYACKHNHVTIVKLILKNDENAFLVNIRGYEEQMPLFYAFQNQNIEILKCFVEFVVENKIKFEVIYDSFVRYRMLNSKMKGLSFIAAVKKEKESIQKLIINTMMQVDKRNLFRDLCIYMQEVIDDTDTASMIEELLADLTQDTKEEWLRCLSSEGFAEPVTILLKTAYGYSMLCLQELLINAIKRKNFKVADLLLEEDIDIDGQLDIVLACLEHKNPQFLKTLVGKAISFDLWPKYQHEKMLKSAVSIGNLECIELIGNTLGKKVVNTCSGLLNIAIKNKSIDLFNCLLDLGAAIGADDSYDPFCGVLANKYPLFLAVESGKIEIVEKLLSLCTIPQSNRDCVKLINLAILTENMSMIKLVLSSLPENVLNEDVSTCISVFTTKNISLFMSLRALGLTFKPTCGSYKMYQSEICNSLLEAAVNTGMYKFVELCCKAGLSISDYGMEINIAIRLNALDIVMYLLECKGKEIFQNIIQESCSWSPVHEAIAKRDKKIIDSILESSSLVDVIIPFLQVMGNSLILLAVKDKRNQRATNSECSTSDNASTDDTLQEDSINAECSTRNKASIEEHLQEDAANLKRYINDVSLQEDVIDSKYSNKELVTILLKKGVKGNMEMLKCLCTEQKLKEIFIWKELISSIDREDWFISDRTLFCLACTCDNMELACLILEHQSSLTRDNGALLYLHAAILMKNREIVKKILEVPGIDVNECLPKIIRSRHLPFTWMENNVYGTQNNALLLASMQKTPEICKYLLQYDADKSIPNEKGFLPLHIAIINNSDDLVKSLLENTLALDNVACEVYNNGRTIAGSPLHISTQLEKVECTKLLLKCGASVNSCCKEHGRTPLFHIAKWKQTNSEIAEVTKMFLNSGADINHMDMNGISLLSVAIEHENTTLVQILLQNGIKRNIIQNLDTDNIIKCIRNFKLKIVFELVNYGYNFEVDDINVSELIATCHKDNDEQICGMIKFLLTHKKMNLEKRDYRGLTALHQCARRNLESVAKLLIAHGCDVNATISEDGYYFERNLKDVNAVAIAILNRNFSIVKILLEGKFILTNDYVLHKIVQSCSEDVRNGNFHFNIAGEENVSGKYPNILLIEQSIELLLKKGIDINSKNQSGYTALHIACQNNIIWMVEILLKHHCNCEAITSGFQCYTPLQIACVQGNLEIAELLVNHGCSVDLLTKKKETLIHLLVNEKLKSNIHLNNYPSFLFFNMENDSESDENMSTNSYYDSDNVEDCNIKHTTKQSSKKIDQEYIYKWKKLVTHMVQNGIDVDAADTNRWCAIHHVVYQGNLLMVQHLLETCKIDQKINQWWFHSFDITSSNPYPFCAPVQIASKKGHMKIMQLLMQHKCTIQVLDTEQKTLLHDLTEYSLVKKSDIVLKMNNARQLLINGIDVNAEDTEGRTALFNAVQSNDQEMAKLLLECNFDFSREVTRKMSSLLLAAEEHHIGILDALLEKGASVNASDDQKQIALHYICSGKNIDSSILCNMYKYSSSNHKCSHICFKSIANMISKGYKVNAQNSKGETPLHKACQSGNFEAVRILLEHGGDPTIVSKSLHTPLASCVIKNANGKYAYLIIKALLEFQNGYYGKKCMIGDALLHCIDNCKPIISKVLLQHGANTNFRLTEGNASLHIACSKINKTSHIPILIAYNARINLKNYKGESPLHVACNNGNFEAVRLLLTSGAIPDIQDQNGWTVYHICTYNKNEELLEYLLRYRGNVDLRTTKEFMGIEAGTTPLLMFLSRPSYNCKIGTLLLQSGANPNQCDSKGDPIVFAAIKIDWVDFSIIEKLILQSCVNINVQNESGLGLIHYAVQNRDISIVKGLIEHHCDVNLQIDALAKENGGQSPLHLVVQRSCLSMVELLIQNGCSMFVEDNTGKTPVDYCVDQKGHFSNYQSIAICATLIKAGGLLKVFNGDQYLHILMDEKDLLTNFFIDAGCKIMFSSDLIDQEDIYDGEYDIQECVDKIVEKQQQPLTLMRLAGNIVRCNIRPNAIHSAKYLPLPESIITFLTFENTNIQLEDMMYGAQTDDDEEDEEYFDSGDGSSYLHDYWDDDGNYVCDSEDESWFGNDDSYDFDDENENCYDDDDDCFDHDDI